MCLTIRLRGRNLIRFTVPGQPIPAERVRHGRGRRFYIPGRTMDYRRKVIAEAVKMFGDVEPRRDGVALVSFFVREGNRNCDIDNLQKAIQDALIGIGYTDDSQVKFIVAGQAPGEEGSVTVYFMSLHSVEVEDGDAE